MISHWCFPPPPPIGVSLPCPIHLNSRAGDFLAPLRVNCGHMTVVVIVVQLCLILRLFATPWSAACQAPPRVCSNLCPLSWWCYLAISSSRFSGGSVVKNLPANAGDARDVGLISGLGRSPGGRNGNTLQYSCLENSMDRGAWWATVHGVTKSWAWLSDWAHRPFTYAPH